MTSTTFRTYLVSRVGRHCLKNGPAVNAPKGRIEQLADRYIGFLWKDVEEQPSGYIVE